MMTLDEVIREYIRVDQMDMGNTDEERRRTENQVNNRTEGHVIKCDGEQAILAAYIDPGIAHMENYWTVGQIISISVGKNRVIGMAHKVDLPNNDWAKDGGNLVHIHVELVGEIQLDDNGEASFNSGIASYPQMGCAGHRIRSEDLSTVYKTQSSNLIRIGNLTQDAEVSAEIDVDKLLSRHFAVVGTTGVGKSTSVTLMLRKIVESRPDIRVLLLDPHNEFASAFPDHSITMDSSNLDLPFWLFKLEELAEVIFRGQQGLEVEYELLRDIIPQAKEIYKEEKNNANKSLVKRGTEKSAISADTPIPYRMVDLLSLIDDRLGRLEGKAGQPILKALQARILSIVQDQRFRFMFDVSGNGGDPLQEIVSKVFRVPQNGKPICVFELSGLPSEVLNSVVSVMCRMAFDLALSSDGAIQTLVVCEEAHRYIPADSGSGFWPTRQAIARIAKEGRKYGVYLGIITQRPGELDSTILSQCNTIFAMRLGNQKDQEIIRDAVTNGAKSTISFLSSIANRECIAFGEALHTPMRLTFETMAAKDLPGAHIYEQQEAVRSGKDISVASVIRKMRNESRRPVENAEIQGGNEHGVPKKVHVAPKAPDEYMPSMAPVMSTPPQPVVASLSSEASIAASERLNRPLSAEPVAADSNSGKPVSQGARGLINAFRSKK